ncbi:hypothetical protein BV898_16102 [Hypsibius exemplaris]|uniref:Uncharacterized protein n=1 Tax=Hypsibius exemplaris TaxID=2072580 RepID=A0A9X6NE60_HYPEX|nr:hypothetical protein BV898_16102 [Hypsibius exemplaris]
MGWTAATHDTCSQPARDPQPPAGQLVPLPHPRHQQPGISLPSVMSEPIRTLGNIRPLPDYDLADIKAKFTQQLVELTEVRAISSTAVNLYWNILRHEEYIGGYFIKVPPRRTWKFLDGHRASRPGADAHAAESAKSTRIMSLSSCRSTRTSGSQQQRVELSDVGGR